MADSGAALQGTSAAPSKAVWRAKAQSLRQCTRTNILPIIQPWVSHDREPKLRGTAETALRTFRRDAAQALGCELCRLGDFQAGGYLVDEGVRGGVSKQ